MTNVTPFETQEEALEGRIRSMGFSVGKIQELGDNLAAVRQTIADMEASGFPEEYGILAPVKQLERAATLQVEPKILAFMQVYQALIEEATATPPAE